MTTAEELQQLLWAEKAEERRNIEETLVEYYRLDQALKGTFVCPDCGSVHVGMKKRKEALEEQLRQFMEKEGEQELTDPESGVRVWFQPSGSTAVFDLTRLPDDVVGRLAKIPGLLAANNPALEALGDTSADLDALRRVRSEKAKAKSLRVEKK